MTQSNQPHYYFSNKKGATRLISPWDILVFLLIIGLLFLLSWGAQQMTTPYHMGKPIPISLSPEYLPTYALRTVLRMFIALLFSLLFTFIFGTWAAKSKRAGELIVPTIDVLQSVPVLSFLSITVVGFIRLFPGSQLGPECASIFAIFTAQAWNMVLGFYQSLKTVPADLIEASRMFQLSGWQRFWKIEVPFSMSSLLWNMMMSMSASWFFVVLSEAISVSGQNIRLPGIGSYIALAIAQTDKWAVLYAILTMLVVIFLYDQLLFRPLITWSQKFKIEETPEEKEYQSWLVTLLRRSRLMGYITHGLSIGVECFIQNKWLNRKPKPSAKPRHQNTDKWLERLWYAFLLSSIILCSFYMSRYIYLALDLKEILHVCYLGFITSLRVIVLIFLSSIVWVPVGVYIGRHPGLTQLAQPIIQFLAAFPANLFYPIVVIGIVTYHLNPEIWLTPLMILGTQWYILFNVIAGASRIPRDLYLAANNFEVKGWLWWKRLALPGIFPYYVTGAITAAGGAWNASIVAEWVSWGKTTLTATGLGEYIQVSTQAGNFPKIALGTTLMCMYVLAFNHLLWRPLYRMAEEKFSLNG